ncbi:MAG: lysophospholipid acyltransferase family protein [Fidelibacterota bacterium]
MKELKHFIEYLLLYSLGLLVRSIPLATAVNLGEKIGTFIYKNFPVRRSVTLINLKNAFPEKSRQEVELIALKTYQNFTKLAVEFLRLTDLKKKTIKSILKFTGLENLTAHKAKKSGGLLLTAHFGNWELAGASLALLGFPLHVIAGTQRNKLVERLIEKYRRKVGLKTIHVKDSVKNTLRALKNGNLVGILGDQDAGKYGISVNFFGIPSSTPRGPAVFAIKMGVPVYTLFTIRMNKGKHRVIIEPFKTDDLQPLNEKNIREFLLRYNKRLENYIYQYPDHWFWPHRRWKSTTQEY